MSVTASRHDRALESSGQHWRVTAVSKRAAEWAGFEGEVLAAGLPPPTVVAGTMTSDEARGSALLPPFTTMAVLAERLSRAGSR